MSVCVFRSSSSILFLSFRRISPKIPLPRYSSAYKLSLNMPFCYVRPHFETLYHIIQYHICTIKPCHVIRIYRSSQRMNRRRAFTNALVDISSTTSRLTALVTPRVSKRMYAVYCSGRVNSCRRLSNDSNIVHLK